MGWSTRTALGSCACPPEVPETDGREGMWPLGCSHTEGPGVCLGPDVDSQVHWARDQLLIAAATVTVGPDVHLRLRATREAQHHLCFMEQGIQKSVHHDQGSMLLGDPCIRGRGLDQV